MIISDYIHDQQEKCHYQFSQYYYLLTKQHASRSPSIHHSHKTRSSPTTMFYDFRNITSSTNMWTFNSIATDTGIPIPPSPLPNQVVGRIYISNILTASFFLKGIAPAFYESASVAATPKITHVLSLVSDKTWHESLVRREVKSAIVHKKIVVPDKVDANLMEWFPGGYIPLLDLPVADPLIVSPPQPIEVIYIITDMSPHCSEICKFIHTALSTTPTSQILVHCHAGISRSAAAIASYLIYAHHMTFRETLNKLRAARPEVNPNLGFRMQLRLWRELECDLLDKEGKEKWENEREVWKLKVGKSDQKADLTALREYKRPVRVRAGVGKGTASSSGVGGGDGDEMNGGKTEDETWSGEVVALST